MIIRVIGAGCKDCDTLYRNVSEAVDQLGLDCALIKVEDLIEIVKLGVMTAPALMIDDKVVLAGRVAKTPELIKLLNEAKA